LTPPVLTPLFSDALRALVIVCCFAGYYASRTMHLKAEADRRGELREPSVVQSPRARLFGGIDNALIGLAYYPAVAIASFFFTIPVVRISTLVAASAAMTVSAFLLYSLFFITKMRCTNCVLANSANILIWCLLGALALSPTQSTP
jgi:uncharacterized membrane protein